MPKNKNIKIKRRALLSGVAALAAVFAIPTAVSAWGPDRPTYQITDDPSSLPTEATFNSITNNAGIGDEREFVRIRNLATGENFTSASGSKYYIEPGGEYEVVLYYHNDASSSYNYEEYEYKGLAMCTKMKAGVPNKISASSEGDISAWLSFNKYSDNLDCNTVTEADGEVYDTLKLATTSDQDITLRYVLGSAKLYNDYVGDHGAGYQNGVGVSAEKLFGDGAYLGYTEAYGLDGLLPACNEYAGRIVFTIHAEQPSAKLSKTASLDGENFYETVDANPGDTITYKVEFTNSGSTRLDNVTFRDKLPAGVSLIPGSVMLYNSNFPEGTVMNDTINETNGENGFIAGSYEPNATFTLYYKVKVNEVGKNVCGTLNFPNTAKVVYEGAESEVADTSTIVVKIDDSECTPPELPRTGPAEIALTLVAIVCIAVGGAYWFRSQKDLEMAKAAQKSAESSEKETENKK